jgi:hypothetical protein
VSANVDDDDGAVAAAAPHRVGAATGNDSRVLLLLRALAHARRRSHDQCAVLQRGQAAMAEESKKPAGVDSVFASRATTIQGGWVTTRCEAAQGRGAYLKQARPAQW